MMLLRPGKLPAEILAGLLARIPRNDPRVLLGPGIGRDAAVLDMGSGRVLVAKMDPVTFAAEDIGWYAVNVNANDVACMGARPAWFMATALLPPGAPTDLANEIFDQLLQTTDALGIELIGGHTEITIGLARPIVCGAMLGEASRDEIITGEGVRPGDAVVLAGSIAVEGTALLAREAPDILRRTGIDDAAIAKARDLLHEPGISIIEAARSLCRVTHPRLMHDPTEGGLATALYEMAASAGSTLRVDMAEVPVLLETKQICRLLGLDAFGLLASGALLAIVSSEDSDSVHGWHNGSMFRRIGTVVDGPPTVIMEPDGVPLPTFGRDELARFFDEMAGGTQAE
jgi:hydrogenase maturation factor